MSDITMIPEAELDVTAKAITRYYSKQAKKRADEYALVSRYFAVYGQITAETVIADELMTPDGVEGLLRDARWKALDGFTSTERATIVSYEGDWFTL